MDYLHVEDPMSFAEVRYGNVFDSSLLKDVRMSIDSAKINMSLT
jgi:hypothetical protein